MNTILIKSKVLLCSAVACLCFSATNANAQEFSYNGDKGPNYWVELNSDWGACAGVGMDAAQSPINITRTKVDRRLKRLQLFTYPTTIDIFNNGHTIEQRYEGTGSSIYFNGLDYELQQFHFHTLSEHTVGSQHSVMELHAVFSTADGANLVISQLFSLGRNKNQFIQKLIDAGLPEKDGDETMTGQSINVGNVLTNTRSYYVYSGSLTTPPCSEGVTWLVLKKPAKITTSQFESFREILGNNFRPLQDKNDRVVRATNDRHDHDD